MKPCDFHYCWSAVGEMLNWQKQTFFSRGGHHKGVMLRAPKWLAAALCVCEKESFRER